MLTLIGTPEEGFSPLMGWYYRQSTDTYEFWWMGSEPKIALAAVMLEVMPFEIVREIQQAVQHKTWLTD